MSEDDEVDALERRLARQSRRTRFAGGVAASLVSLLAIGAAIHGLSGGSIKTFIGGLVFAAFGLVGAARLFQGRSTDGLRMHLGGLGFTDEEDRDRP